MKSSETSKPLVEAQFASTAHLINNDPNIAFESKGVWVAFIRKLDNKKSMTFPSFEEAARQRDAWELELYGFNKDNKARE